MPKHQLTKERFKELFNTELITPPSGQPRRLSAGKFEAIFGMKLPRRPSRRVRERAKGVDELFFDMYVIYGVATLEVFKNAVTELHNKTLHNMAGCPQFVVDHMKRQLEPDRVEEFRKKQARKLRGIVERAEAVLRRIT